MVALIPLLVFLIGCKQYAVDSQQSTGGTQQTSTVELKYGETKMVSLLGKSYSVQLTEVLEERCADCTVCYKPNGIYADASLLINGVKTSLRIYSCTLTEEVTWEKIKQRDYVVAINESLDAGLVRLAPSVSDGKKESYVAKVVFMY